MKNEELRITSALEEQSRKHTHSFQLSPLAGRGFLPLFLGK
jgi:hypothetical protein